MKRAGGKEKRTHRRSKGGWGHPQALTTSSMMGSGLAASSCSFTFSSTRGRKTTTEAGWKGATTLPDRQTAAAGPWESLGFLAPPLPLAPNYLEVKILQRQLWRKGLGFSGRRQSGDEGGPAGGSQLE